MGKSLSKELLFIYQLSGILSDFHQEVLGGRYNGLLQVLQRRLLAVIEGKFSFFLDFQKDKNCLKLESDQICFHEKALGPSLDLLELADEIKSRFSSPIEYQWAEQIIREPCSVYCLTENKEKDLILSRLFELGIKFCIRIPIMVKWSEEGPRNIIGFIIIVTDEPGPDAQRINTLIADSLSQIESQIFTIEFQTKYKEAKVRSYSALIDFFVSALDQRGPFIHGHSTRVKDICLEMVKSDMWGKKGLPEINEENLKMATELHDVGKQEISPQVVFKPGVLIGDEVAEFEKHSAIGANFAYNYGLGDDTCLGILYHHKNYDGTGYPRDDKKREDIPIIARIISVACAFDSAYSEKSYRIKEGDKFDYLWDLQSAYDKVRNLKNDSKLDPRIAHVLLNLYEKGKEEKDKYIKLIQEGNKMAEDKLFIDAIKNYENALDLKIKNKKDKETICLSLFLADFFRKKIGNIRKALEYCDQAIETDATIARSYYERAKLLSNIAEYRKALNDCDRAIILAPTYIEAYLEKGRIYCKMGMEYYKEAEECFNKVLAMDESNLEASFEIAKLLKSQEELDEALEICNKILNIDSFFSEAYTLKSGIYKLQGKTEKAKIALEDALKADKWKNPKMKKIVENAIKTPKENE